MDTLLNFTGGLDSTYCLYDHLTKPDHSKLLVHHCRIVNKENRAKYEDRAIADVLTWMRNNVSKNFEYVETEFHHPFSGYLPFDAQIVAFMTGVILRQPEYSGLKYTIGPLIRDETERLGRRLNRRWENEKLIRQCLSRKNLVVLRPAEHMKKTELWDALPRELARLTFSCRKPDKIVANNRCGECHTCKQLAGRW